MTARDAPSALVVAGADLGDSIGAALEAIGVGASLSTSPRDAAELAKHAFPDLIVVDTTAPEFDGIAAIRHLKGSLDTFVPIIAMCPLGDAEAKRRAVEAGVDDFAVVPLSEIELSLRVRAILRLSRLGDELNRLTLALHSATVTDPLTALHNERAMRDFLVREYARARRYQRTLSLLIIDVDGLRRVNEVQSRDAGDQMLRDVADLIRREVRESDIAGRSDGTYWILAPETDGESAIVMAERLRRSANQGTPATVSIGVATMPAVMAATADALLDLAQTALRRAKAEGRNCCRSAE